MTRYQLEHVIRAASTVSDDDEIIIVGSQSILGPHPDAPASLLASEDADVYPRKHPERWELIDGSLGQDSPFHLTFGYYAQGVGPETAILPAGWEKRMIPIQNANTRGATGWTLDTHDLALSKYAAAREKDFVFLKDAISAGLLNETVLRERLEALPVDSPTRDRIGRQISAHFKLGSGR